VQAVQETRVHQLDPATAKALERALREALPPDADWRPAPYAHFSVKSNTVVATLYRSGKLVLQGSGLDAFEKEFLDGVAVTPPQETPEELRFVSPLVGSDETGKGDYFGPLVVACVYADPAQAPELLRMGAADSKSVSDAQARRAAAVLSSRFDHEVLSLMPEEYNRRYAEVGNLNVLLAELHAEIITRLLARHWACGLVLVDRFAAADVLERALSASGAKCSKLVQVPGGERNPVVAAASILARDRFLADLAKCEEASASDLHKGAGPEVEKAARRVLEIGGVALLSKVAKLHFKTTRKLGVSVP
jgi:ribonuclease HIII